MATSTGSAAFTANNLLLVNQIPTDAEGGRGAEVTMKGVTAAGAMHTLGRMAVEHRTTASNPNAAVTFSVNDGANGQTAALRVDADAVVVGAPVYTPQVTVDGLTLVHAAGALVLAGTAAPGSVLHPTHNLVDTATEAILETTKPLTLVAGAPEAPSWSASLLLACPLSGSVADEVAPPRTGTLTGAPAFGRPGRGRALALVLRNPVESTAALANTAPTQLVDWTGTFAAPLTVAWWVNTEWTARTVLLSLSAGTGAGAARALDVSVQAGILTAAWTLPTFANTVTVATAAVQAGTWYHVAVTLGTAHDAKLYLNGVLQSSATGTGAFTPATHLRLGAAPDHYHPARARYNDLRVWARVLSAADILQLYQGTQRTFLVANLHPGAAGREKRLVLQSGLGARRTAVLSAATPVAAGAGGGPVDDLVWHAPLDGTLLEAVGCRPPTPVGPVAFSTAVARTGRGSLDLRANTVGAAPAAHVAYPVNAGLVAGPVTIAGWLHPGPGTSPGRGADQVVWALGGPGNAGAPEAAYELTLTAAGGLTSTHRTGGAGGPGLVATPPVGLSAPAAWTHVAATLVPGGLHQLFVNGQAVASVAMDADSGGLALGSGARPTGIRLGGSWAAALPVAWGGLVQDVRLYTRALAAAEVATLAAVPDLSPAPWGGALGAPPLADLAVHLPLALSLEDSRGALPPPTVVGTERYSTSVVAAGAGALDLRANEVGTAGATAVQYALPAGSVGAATALTVAAWVHPAALVGGPPVPLALGTLAAPALQVGLPQGVPTVEARVAGATVTVAAPTAVAVDQWVHLAVAVAAGQPVQLYVNGFRVAASGAALGSGVTLQTAAGAAPTHLQVGRGLGAAANEAFSGLLNDVRLYTRALAATEVAALAGAAQVLVGPTSVPGLYVYAPLDAGTGADRASALIPTVAGSLAWTLAGAPTHRGGGALDLRGHAVGATATQHLTYPIDVAAGSGWTLAAWLQPQATTGGWQVPLSLGTAAAWVHELVLHTSTGQWYADALVNGDLYRPVGTGTAATQAEPQGWLHLALVADAGTRELGLWVAGVAVGTVALPALPALTHLRVGGQLGETEPRAFAGLVQDVRLYRRALHRAEVRTLAGGPAGVATALALAGSLGAGLAFRAPLEAGPGAVAGGGATAAGAPAVTGAVAWAVDGPAPPPYAADADGTAAPAGALDLRANVEAQAAGAYLTYPLAADGAATAAPLTAAVWLWRPVGANVAAASTCLAWGQAGGAAPGAALALEVTAAGQVAATATVGGATHTATSAQALAQGVWQHVVVVVEGGRPVQLYVDGTWGGQSAGTVTAGGLITTGAGAPPNQLRLGAPLPATLPTAFRGLLSDVRLYRRALGPAEVAVLAGAWPGPRAQRFRVQPPGAATWAGVGAAAVRVGARSLQGDAAGQLYAPLGQGAQAWNVPRTGLTWAAAVEVPAGGLAPDTTLLWAGAAGNGATADSLAAVLGVGAAPSTLVFRYKGGGGPAVEGTNQATVTVEGGWTPGRVQLVTAVVSPSGAVQVYLDGVVVGSALLAAALDVFAPALCLVGRHGEDRARPTWPGRVYLVEAWEAALTASQAAAHAAAVKGALAQGALEYDALATFRESTTVVVRNRTHSGTLSVVPLGATRPSARWVWSGMGWQEV